jgi:hypothetical protein
MAISNKWMKHFNHVSMHQLLKYLLSQNCESQALAINATAQDIQTTGTKQVILNGIPITLAADSVYDVSAELPYALWSASSVSYTTGGILSEVVDSEGKHWVCIAAHTSTASNGPGMDGGLTYWKRLDKWAVMGNGNVVAQDKQAHYLVCALADGTLRAFLAYVPGTEAATTPIVIPAYDPERYVAIGLISVVPTSGSHTFGTTVLTTVGTFKQFTGLVLPDADLIDLN